MLSIRPATPRDADAIWCIVEPVLRAGETYTLPTDMSRDDALSYWFAATHEPFVAEDDGEVIGAYYLRANQGGGGGHVANCGYMTARSAQGKGVARAMLVHSLARARERGFRAMQFNFVVSTNERARRTWEAHGFEVVGRLPAAFHHPRLGYVDALVMYKDLTTGAQVSASPGLERLPETGETLMQYAILCYDSETLVGSWSQQKDDALMARLGKVQDGLDAKGKLGPVARLLPTTAAVTVRPGQEPFVIDGPFAETKEQLLGFYVVDADSLEEVIEVAKSLLHDSGALEIRPVRMFRAGGRK